MAVVNFTMPEIFEFAARRAGKELQTGEDMREARWCFNLLMLQWQNEGINLWTVDEETQALTIGDPSYTLTAGTVDILEAVYRDENSKDYMLNRMSYSEYARLNDKNMSGRPTRYLVERLATASNIILWPVPDKANSVVYWRMRGLDGLSSGIGEGTNADMPPRFVPALIAGLAFHLAANDPALAPRVQSLDVAAQTELAKAQIEDRQRGTLKMVPKVR